MFATLLSFAAAGSLYQLGPDPDPLLVVAGRVADSRGNPVAGAVVRDRRAESDPLDRRGGPAPAVTAADGSFRLIYSRPPTRPALLATHPDGPAAGLAAGSPPGSYDGSHPPGGWPAAELVMTRPVRVEVTVRDAAGAPVAGAAAAALYDFLPAAAPDEPTETDAAGRATLHVPAAAQIVEAVATKGGAGLDAVRVIRWDATETAPIAAELVLEGATPVRVRAVTAEGAPAAGVTLAPVRLTRSGWPRDRLEAYGHWFDTNGAGPVARTTGADGVAAFDYMPADRTGGAGGDFRLASRDPARDVSGDPRPDPDRPGDYLVRLAPRVELSGTVTRADGAPAVGAVIRVEGPRAPSGEAPRFALTDRSGRYRLPVPSGEAYAVGVGHGGRADPAATAPPRVAVAVGVRPDPAGPFAAAVAPGGTLRAEPVGGVNFRLGRGTRLGGTVRTTDGAAVPDARVVAAFIGDGVTIPGGEARSRDGLAHAAPELTYRTRADAAGRYAFRLGAGTYRLFRFTANETSRDGRPVVVPFNPGPDPPGLAEDVEVPAPETEFDFVAYVTDARGRDAAGVRTWGFYPSPEYGGTTATNFTGGTGRSRHGRRRGAVTFTAVRPDGTAAAALDLGPDDPVADVALRLEPTGSAFGRLLDPTGRPVFGARVAAGLDVPTRYGPMPVMTRGARTGPDGTYLITGLIAGRTYGFYLRGADPADPGGGGRTRLDIFEATADGVARPDYDLPPGEAEPNRYRDLGRTRGRVTESALGSTGDRRAAAFARGPDDTNEYAADRLGRTVAVAATLNRRVVAVVAGPADPAAPALWELLGTDPAVRAASENYVFHFAATGPPPETMTRRHRKYHGTARPAPLEDLAETAAVPTLAVLAAPETPGDPPAIAATLELPDPAAAAAAAVAAFLEANAAGSE